MAVSVAFGWWPTSDTAGESASSDSAPGEPALHPAALFPTAYAEPWVAAVAQNGPESTAPVTGGDAGANPAGDDPIHELGFTIEPTPTRVPTVKPPSIGAQASSASNYNPSTGSLTRDEMVTVLFAAGWPAELHEQALAVAWCESKWSGATGDSGQSLGIFQLWRGWFRAGEDAYDSVTNASVALRVYQTRGRWGGGGGWTCADHLGIY